MNMIRRKIEEFDVFDSDIVILLMGFNISLLFDYFTNHEWYIVLNIGFSFILAVCVIFTLYKSFELCNMSWQGKRTPLPFKSFMYSTRVLFLVATIIIFSISLKGLFVLGVNPYYALLAVVLYKIHIYCMELLYNNKEFDEGIYIFLLNTILSTVMLVLCTVVLANLHHDRAVFQTRSDLFWLFMGVSLWWSMCVICDVINSGEDTYFYTDRLKNKLRLCFDSKTYIFANYSFLSTSLMYWSYK